MKGLLLRLISGIFLVWGSGFWIYWHLRIWKYGRIGLIQPNRAFLGFEIACGILAAVCGALLILTVVLRKLRR